MKDDIRLVGLDLDGTLLDGQRKLTQRTIDALRLASEHGIHMVIDSGRAFMAVPEEIRALPFMRYFILCNGASIYDKQEDRILYSAEIPLEASLEIYDAMTEHPNMYCDCYLSDGAWARGADFDRIEEFVADPTHRDVLYKTRTPKADLRAALIERDKPVQKFQGIYMDTATRDAELRRLQERFPQMGLTTAYTYNLEINMPEATKGIGLLKLAEILGLKREQTASFGDSANDLAMLECAGIGYAMENADEKTKAAADRIAPPNTVDGVAQVLEAWVREMG